MEFRYEHNGKTYNVQLDPQPDGSYSARVGDRICHVYVQRMQPGQLNLIIDDRRVHAYYAQQYSAQTDLHHHHIALVDWKAQVYELTTARTITPQAKTTISSGELSAQMPGQVTQILAQLQDKVEHGQTIMILEAMKMEIRVTSPLDGIVTRLAVAEGETVERGQLLAEIK